MMYLLWNDTARFADKCVTIVGQSAVIGHDECEFEESNRVGKNTL